MKIERYENGALKSISISLGGNIISALFWLAVLLFLVLVLPVFVAVGAVFGVILAVAKVAELIHNAWRNFRKPQNWEVLVASWGRARR